MKQEHLSDDELQQLALEQEVPGQQWEAHIQQCAKCATAIADYRAMFAALSAMEKPVLNLDMERQILSKLPVVTTAKRPASHLPMWLGIAAITMAGITVWVMGNYFKELLKGVDSMMLCLLVATAITITVLQCREMLATYRKKMELLKFYQNTAT